MSSLTQLFLSPLASPSCPSPHSLLLSVSTVLDVLLSFTPLFPRFLFIFCILLLFSPLTSSVLISPLLLSLSSLPLTSLSRPTPTFHLISPFSFLLVLLFSHPFPLFSSRFHVLSFTFLSPHLPSVSPHSLPLSLLFLCAGKQDTAEQIPAEFLLLRYTLVYTQTHAYAHT